MNTTENGVDDGGKKKKQFVDCNSLITFSRYLVVLTRFPLIVSHNNTIMIDSEETEEAEVNNPLSMLMLQLFTNSEPLADSNLITYTWSVLLYSWR